MRIVSKGIKFWFVYVVVNERAPIPDNVYEYDYNDPEIGFFRGSRYDPELREFKKFLRINWNINDSENNWCFFKRNSFETTKKIYPTNKTDVYHIVDIWSLDILDLKDYGPEKETEGIDMF